MPPPPTTSRGTVLITGASGGIGRELAECFARDGHRLVLVARNREALERSAQALAQAHGVTATVIVTDLARAEAPAELAAALSRQHLDIDILVNNAGFGAYGLFAKTDLVTELEMLQLNIVSLTHLTKLLLPGMLQRRSGKILNVASTAAFQPGPLMAVYYASKAYVLSFSEALANELRGTGVSVTALCPGPTPTGFQQRSGMAPSRLLAGHLLDAATVARIGYDGLMRNKALVIPGLRNRVLAFAVRLVPRTAATRIVRYIQERREPVAR